MKKIDRKISDIRMEYSKRKLSKKDVVENPMEQFKIWFEEAIKSEIPDPNAFAFSSISPDGYPETRTLLLKGYDEDGFVFYTNYTSKKGLSLNENNKGCINFFWQELERQVRITGTIEKVSEELSDEYFASRPYKSRIGAWVSPQSQEIPNRTYIKTEFAKLALKFTGQNIPRPSHWGGYILKPIRIEFWQGRSNRLHDRIEFVQEGHGWHKKRLAP